MPAADDYCAFTKAVEHLGDRWSLLIVRELAIHPRLGFNALASGLPGISRSVLARRLRKLDELGLIERSEPLAAPGTESPYRLAPAGAELVPTLHSLHAWAERWVPEDPAMAQRDPTILAVWLAERVVTTTLPAQPVVVELSVRGRGPGRQWLVLESHAGPSVCLDDPGLPIERYVYVETDVAGLYPLARGSKRWSDAIADGSVRVYGEPKLVRALPVWFEGSGHAKPSGTEPASRPDLWSVGR